MAASVCVYAQGPCRAGVALRSCTGFQERVGGISAVCLFGFMADEDFVGKVRRGAMCEVCY